MKISQPPGVNGREGEDVFPMDTNGIDLNLCEDLCIFTSFHFPNPGLYLLNAFVL